MSDYMQSRVESYGRRSRDREEVAVRLVKAGEYKAAIAALADAYVYQQLENEYRSVLEVGDDSR